MFLTFRSLRLVLCGLWVAAWVLASSQVHAQACVTNKQCASDFCAGGQCAAPKGDGQSCGNYLECASKNCVNKMCVPVGAGGCTTGNQCASGLCANRQCVPARPDGSACDVFQQCQSKNCTNRVCTATLPNGSPCTTGNECRSGLCASAICTQRAGGAVPDLGQGSGSGSSTRPATADEPLVRRDDAGLDRRWTAAFLLQEIKTQIAANNDCGRLTQQLSLAGSGGFHVYWPAFYRDAVAAPNECAYRLIKAYMARFQQTFSEADQKSFGTAGMTTNRHPGVPLSFADAGITQHWIDRMVSDGIDKNRLLLAAARDCSSANHRAREAVAYLVRYKGADLEFGSNADLLSDRVQTPGDLIRANCSDIPLAPPRPIPSGKGPADLAAQRGACTPALQARNDCGSRAPAIAPQLHLPPLPPDYIPATPGRTR